MIQNTTGLSIEQILKSDDRPIEYVDCPEWGGRVYIRPLSGEQRGLLEEKIQNSDSMIGIREWITAAGTCDAKGEPLGWSAKQVSELAEKNAAPLDRISGKVQSLSKMSSEEVEELEKNLESVPSDSSG